MIRSRQTTTTGLLRTTAAFVAAIVLIYTLLVVPSSSTAQAADRKVGVWGTVVGTVQSDQIDVATRSGVVTIEIDNRTKLRGTNSRGKRRNIRISTVESGMTVAGYYTQGDEGPIAKSLTFIKRKSITPVTHVVGVVVEENGSELTVETSNGDLVEVTNEDAGASEVEPGSMIAAAVETDESTGELKAVALQTAKETVDRLSASIDHEISNAQRELLKIRMSETAAVHMTRLHETLDQIKADSQARIQAAYAQFQANYDVTLQEASGESVGVSVTGEVLSAFASELHLISGPNGARWHMSVTPATAVELLSGAPGTVVDIKAGMTVQVDATPGSPPAWPVAKIIRVVPATAPSTEPSSTPPPSDDTISGTIAIVEDGTGGDDTVVVVVSDDGNDTAAALTDDTVVIVDGEELTVDELEPGQDVEIVLDEDGFSAEEITAVDPVEPAPTPVPGATTPSIAAPPIEYTLIGTLRAIEDTGVVLDGVQVQLNDFSTSWDTSTVGQQVELQFYVGEEGQLVVTGTK